MKKASFLLNPFERIAGGRALWLGLIAIVAAGMLGGLGGLVFDGAIDAHFHPTGFSMGRAVAMHLIDWAVVTLAMLLAAAICYRGKFRTIDIAGTMALARAPMLVVALLALLPIAPERIDITEMARVILFGLITLAAVIWMIALMWKGFSVSCNARGAKGAWVFVVALLVAEIAIDRIYVMLDWKLSFTEVLKNLPL